MAQKTVFVPDVNSPFYAQGVAAGKQQVKATKLLIELLKVARVDTDDRRNGKAGWIKAHCGDNVDTKSKEWKSASNSFDHQARKFADAATSRKAASNAEKEAQKLLDAAAVEAAAVAAKAAADAQAIVQAEQDKAAQEAGANVKTLSENEKGAKLVALAMWISNTCAKHAGNDVVLAIMKEGAEILGAK